MSKKEIKSRLEKLIKKIPEEIIFGVILLICYLIFGSLELNKVYEANKKNISALTKWNNKVELQNAKEIVGHIKDSSILKEEVLKEEIERLEGTFNFKEKQTGTILGLSLQKLKSPERKMLADYAQYMGDKNHKRIFVECESVVCLINKIYDSKDELMGLYSYYFYLKTGSIISMTNMIPEQNSKYPGVYNGKSHELKDYLLSRSELQSLVVVAKNLPTSMSFNPIFKAIVKVPDNQFEKDQNDSCTKLQRSGNILVRSDCLKEDEFQEKIISAISHFNEEYYGEFPNLKRTIASFKNEHETKIEVSHEYLGFLEKTFSEFPKFKDGLLKIKTNIDPIALIILCDESSHPKNCFKNKLNENVDLIITNEKIQSKTLSQVLKKIALSSFSFKDSFKETQEITKKYLLKFNTYFLAKSLLKECKKEKRDEPLVPPQFFTGEEIYLKGSLINCINHQFLLSLEDFIKTKDSLEPFEISYLKKRLLMPYNQELMRLVRLEEKDEKERVTKKLSELKDHLSLLMKKRNLIETSFTLSDLKDKCFSLIKGEIKGPIYFIKKNDLENNYLMPLCDYYSSLPMVRNNLEIKRENTFRQSALFITKVYQNIYKTNLKKCENRRPASALFTLKSLECKKEIQKSAEDEAKSIWLKLEHADYFKDEIKAYTFH